MHWLWGFSDQIKSWLSGVRAYLQRKCGQSWLHSCWFSFTRARGEGDPKSPLIVWVNWALFESREFVIPGGSSKERWGQEAPTGSAWVPMERVFLHWWCLAEPGLGRKLRGLSSSALLGIPDHKERYLMGCANGLCCSGPTLSSRLRCHWISCLQCCILHAGSPTTIQRCQWGFSFKMTKKMGFVLKEVIALFQMLSQRKCFVYAVLS